MKRRASKWHARLSLDLGEPFLQGGLDFVAVVQPEVLAACPPDSPWTLMLESFFGSSPGRYTAGFSKADVSFHANIHRQRRCPRMMGSWKGYPSLESDLTLQSWEN